MDFNFPEAFQELFKPHRYKVFYGGRGSGKSWSVARALLLLGYTKPLRILCVREIQKSISDSVHKLLSDQIEAMKLSGFYGVTKNSIVGANGTEFIFKGIRFNAREIKSTEGVDICWVEEAEAVSVESWDVLVPTIRKDKSEIWVTFNPLDESDPTFQRFIAENRPDAYVRKVNYNENPYFPESSKLEMEWVKERDYEAYLHIWEGEVRKHSNAIIFANRYRVEDFETPRDARFYHGADWGFANDPTVLIRCFVQDRTIYIDREAWGVGVDLDETPALFNIIETASTWPIKADNSRPETISFMKRRGFRISGAKKWSGCVEDGIAYLKSMDIVIHPRCRHTIDEFAHYSYKVDKATMDVLPVVVDAWNHCIDALRYSQDGLIKGRGQMRINPAALMR
jgi:phage terminase large subunit